MINYTIKEISKNERPMEKLKQYGTEALSNVELLAILIGHGTKQKNAIFLADEVLRKTSYGKELLYEPIETIMRINGIGLSKATRIKAGLELGKRLSQLDNLIKIRITSPQSVANYLFEYFRDSFKEEFCVLFLNTKNEVINSTTISIGTLNQTLVHPREVFREAISKNCNSIIISHNHPSGDPTPSKEDIIITERLCESGNILGIKILDHIIIGNNKFISLKEKRLVRGL